ncbi:MAG: hypothetical protein KAI08_08480 [Bacteroidales bacterium]|nr:hypothetical protein [Bacteroidales bacterium]
MKKFFVLLAPLFLSAFLSARPEEPTPSVNNDVMWHTITVIDYKPGTTDAAKALIQKFETASVTSGTILPEIYWFESGKYDLVVTWKLQNGPADLQEKWSPAGDTWWNALVAQEGSEAAAKKLQADYNELVASSVTSVARKAK